MIVEIVATGCIIALMVSFTAMCCVGVVKITHELLGGSP